MWPCSTVDRRSLRSPEIFEAKLIKVQVGLQEMLVGVRPGPGLIQGGGGGGGGGGWGG